jgi:hypothetical protein
MAYDWGQGLKGGAGGALTGAAAGSVFGPVGTGVGAAVGGGLGMLSGWGGGENENDEARRKMLMDMYAQSGGRMAPQGTAAQSGYSGFRANQGDLVGRLDALSRGQGPSLAAQQFQQATDRNMASQQSMAQSGRGGPLAAFNAANNMGQLGAQAAQGSAMARVQEQQMALGMLGNTLHQGRGADEQVNMHNTGQANQMTQTNMDARLRQMGLDDQTRLSILSQLGGQNQIAHQPGVGDQLLAGGAGAFSQYATNSANSKQAPSSMPTGGGINQIWRNQLSG